MASIFDEYLTQPSNQVPINLPQEEVSPFDQYLTQPNTSKSVEQIAQNIKPQSWLDKMTSPVQNPEPFSWGNVGLSTGIGAGIGFATTGVGAPVGALAGAASGILGEMSKSAGNSPATTLGFEMLGGELPVATKFMGGAAIKALNYRGGRIADLFADPNLQAKQIIKVKQDLFGKGTFDGMYTTENSEATQAALKSEFNLQGNGKASDLARNQFYDDLKGLKDTTTPVDVNLPLVRSNKGIVVSPASTKTANIPTVFRTSPEYTNMITELEGLVQRPGQMNESELSTLKKVISNELSKDPKVAPHATQDLLNLIQNGGVYKVSQKGADAETKTLIPDAARQILKEHFDGFLESKLGTAKYQQLKDIEKQEYIAQARDSIPTMLHDGFKVGDTAFEAALNNIKQSPEGKQEFADAINQHFLQFGKENTNIGSKVGLEIDPKTLRNEFRRLRPAIEQSGVMSRQQIVDLTNSFDKLPKNLSNMQRSNIIKGLIRAPLVGTISATSTQQRTNNPLDVFNL